MLSEKAALLAKEDMKNSASPALHLIKMDLAVFLQTSKRPSQRRTCTATVVSYSILTVDTHATAN